MKRIIGYRQKVGIGITVFLLAVGLFVAAGIRQDHQYEARLAQEIASSGNSTPQEIDVSEKQRISVTRTEIVITEEEVPFTTMQTYDGTLPKDSTVVRIEGSNGKKVVKTEVKTKDGVEISRALISEEITVPPIARVVAIGTKETPSSLKRESKSECDANYKPCIPNVRRDLDCDDIGIAVQIIGEDRHNFDEDDQDGIGCERF